MPKTEKGHGNGVNDLLKFG